MLNYPLSFDDETSLLAAKDSLKATLAEDYYPGNLEIVAEDNIEHFPTKGIITLIDQISSHKERAISFKYNAREGNVFKNLELINSIDVFKPKKFTNINLQVRAEHHNAIKDAIISIQKTLGTKKSIFEENKQTIIGRINHINKLIYAPKAWFEVDNATGLAPFTVQFKNLSQGSFESMIFGWDFGDGDKTTTTEKNISKTFTKPGIYDITLSAKNIYGEDKVTLKKLIKSQLEAPEEVKIRFLKQNQQIVEENKIRTSVNEFVAVEIPDSIFKNITFAGEHIINKKIIDPITSYTWSMGDDLLHANSKTTKGIYNQGGIYDLVVRTDTELGSYRITTFENAIDVVEDSNFWLWTENNQSIEAHEFGLYSETFKLKNNTGFRINRDDSFATGNQLKEFKRNNGFTQKSEHSSGAGGDCIFYWSSNKNTINFAEYNAFGDFYNNLPIKLNRNWNWASLASPEDIYFILGNAEKSPPSMSLSNMKKTTLNLSGMTFEDDYLEGYIFINGAEDLQYPPAQFNKNGSIIDEHYTIYRTAWRDNIGYILRNNEVGEYLSLINFYKTDGTLGEPFKNIVKLTNVPEASVKEGQLVSLDSGVFLFRNHGSAFVYKEDTATWETTGGNTGLFRSLQDTKIVDYDNPTNSLLAAGLGQKAFLSFDYSNNCFLKFSEIDLSFHMIGKKPKGEQWLVGIY